MVAERGETPSAPSGHLPQGGRTGWRVGDKFTPTGPTRGASSPPLGEMSRSDRGGYLSAQRANLKRRATSPTNAPTGTPMRPVIYYVAVSVDGYIAHADGTWDGFLPDGQPVTDYLAALGHFDTVLMGRRTYEVGVEMGTTDPYPAMDSYVFSRTMTESPDERVTLVSENAPDVVRSLKEKPGRPIYLCGGADLAAALFAEGLVDELILKVNPVVLGKGIPLFSGVVPQTALDLVRSLTYANGCVWLSYQVKGD